MIRPTYTIDEVAGALHKTPGCLGSEMTDPITVTIQQACALSGLSRTTIYRLIADGSLAPLKVRGRTLITYASLSRILRAA